MTASIALIGYGAIARAVCAAMAGIERLRLGHVLVREARRPEVARTVGAGVKVISTLDALDERPALIVECASHEAVTRYGPDALRHGLDFAVVSIGALADPAVERALETAAREGGGRAHFVAGAIGEIDALAAARLAGLERVVYVSSKPPLAWRGTAAEERHELRVIATPTVLYEGPAPEAARLYPKNANVAATVALAGLGFERTLVRLSADPAAEGNIHRVEADGRFGRITIGLVGNPLPGNPTPRCSPPTAWCGKSETSLRQSRSREVEVPKAILVGGEWRQRRANGIISRYPVDGAVNERVFDSLARGGGRGRRDCRHSLPGFGMTRFQAPRARLPAEVPLPGNSTSIPILYAN